MELSVDPRTFVVAIAFSLFILCPRLAGMCSIVSRTRGLNPYVVAAIGVVVSIPLVLAMVYVVEKYGVYHAVLVAIVTDVISGLIMGLYSLRSLVEVLVLALFIWVEVVAADHIVRYIAG